MPMYFDRNFKFLTPKFIIYCKRGEGLLGLCGATRLKMCVRFQLNNCSEAFYTLILANKVVSVDV